MADDLKLHGEIEIDTKKANEAFSELEGKSACKTHKKTTYR